MQTPLPQKKTGFDVTAVIAKALSYVRHGRLMVAMACLGLLAGMAYFVYSTPLYSSKSSVYVRVFGSPIRSNEIPETSQGATGLHRGVIQEFSSRKNIIAAAQRLKLVGPSAVWEDVLLVVPSVVASVVDSSHMEVTVLAKDKEVVRGFASALVEEFRLQQEATWAQFRDEALQRYTHEMAMLDKHVQQGITDLSQFDREGKVTETAIEQSQLNEVPKDLVVTKELIRRMDEVKAKLDEFRAGLSVDAEPTIDNILLELSLLGAFEKEREVQVGELVRRPMPGATTPVSAVQSPTEVVVQPGMIETLAPWQDLEKQRRVLQDKIKEAAKAFLPGHQIMRDLAADLEDNERSLRAELSVLRQRFDLEYAHYQDKLVVLQQRLPDYHRVNEELGRSSQAYASLEKNKVFWDRARERLADKLAVVTFAEDRDWVEMRFNGHTSLRDDVPVSPNKMKLVMLSLLFALGGALGAPTLVNLMDNSVTTLQQLEESTGLTGIGIIPHTSARILEDIYRSPAIGSKVPNYLLENFRLIRSHIVLHPSKQGKAQVVMVTSARPSEGKTSQAANLAWAFHSMGSRTLLIDCDLRRGRVHHFTDVSNEGGMTRLLLGQLSLTEAIQKTPAPQLDIIPRGPIITGTTELLCQSVFDELIEKLRGEYDQIVLDTPPVLGLSETATLQRVVDGVVVVVRAEITSRKDVTDAVGTLRRAGAHFFGMVLNDLDLSKVSNYYNYYYYSASYYEDVFGDDTPLNRAEIA
ncbi:MAG: polysaccharide biosynthesis tyrosine autokinase [Verrucomicrobiales bacterium]|nr:polysaccharide biosynthesis tyrosine autokinase [Verrucomicrobiales bacterium]MCP5559310.1 polysaccharide biosynthesis tyrosine autokinase [Verrucomicrobiaceae bacterium]